MKALRSAIANFPFEFWILCLFSFCTIGTLWPFIALSPDLWNSKWDYTPEEAGVVSACLAVVSIVCCSLAGTFFDHFGYRPQVATFFAALLAAAYYTLAFSSLTPWVGAMAIGVCLGVIVSAYIGMISLCVPSEGSGTAIGIGKIFENSAYFIFPAIFGLLTDYSGSFTFGLQVFATAAVASFCLIIIVWTRDVLILDGKLSRPMNR